MLQIQCLLLLVMGLSGFVRSTSLLTNRNQMDTDLAAHIQNRGISTNTDTLDAKVKPMGVRKFTRHLDRNGIRRKRSVSLASMVKCGAKGEREFLVSFGKYCGIGGSGIPVNDIDRCCECHDECYHRWVHACWSPTTKYTATYNWYCDDGRPYCGQGSEDDDDYSDANDICDSQICQCDAKFVECLNEV